MIVKKVFVNNDNMATFVCSRCKNPRTMNVMKYIGKAVSVEHIYRCSACGYEQPVLLERRRFMRRDVSIPGTYILKRDKLRVTHVMTVKDLSRSGLKIELHEPAELNIGDRLQISFRLDNKQRTPIQKDVFVRTIKGLVVGTEFCSRDPKNPIDKAYDIALGFYTLRRR